MTPREREALSDVAAKYALHPEQITSGLGNAYGRVLAARVEVAKRLYEAGYSAPRIGRLLQRDHTTILYYLGRMKTKKPTPYKFKWRKPRVVGLYAAKPLAPEQLFAPEPKRGQPIPYAGKSKY